MRVKGVLFEKKQSTEKTVGLLNNFRENSNPSIGQKMISGHSKDSEKCFHRKPENPTQKYIFMKYFPEFSNFENT